VQDYCINRLAHERREHFIILCLDNQNRLISEETISVGTVNQTAVYTRYRKGACGDGDCPA
jgi:DNA repair protein RadC